MNNICYLITRYLLSDSHLQYIITSAPPGHLWFFSLLSHSILSPCFFLSVSPKLLKFWNICLPTVLSFVSSRLRKQVFWKLVSFRYTDLRSRSRKWVDEKKDICDKLTSLPYNNHSFNYVTCLVISPFFPPRIYSLDLFFGFNSCLRSLKTWNDRSR